MFLKYSWLILVVHMVITGCSGNRDLKIMVVTGGHDFNEEAFFELFNSFENVSYSHSVQPEANEIIASEKVNNYDVLVFYDMYDSITQHQKDSYIQLLGEGKGMIFLHHALVSYQGWEEFKKIIGGKYYQDSAMVNGIFFKSTYEHDLHVNIHIEDPSHPILSGITDFTVFDEVYGNCEILPEVHPLLSTNHPQSMNYVAWINSFGNSKIVYLQLGHGPEAFGNENFKKILHQAVIWSANQHP